MSSGWSCIDAKAEYFSQLDLPQKIAADWLLPTLCDKGGIVNDHQLRRSLQSIGMACFVRYFPQFSDAAICKEKLIDLIMQQENYMKSGTTTRVTQARRIIDSERTLDALLIVASSARVSGEVSMAASRLALNLQR